MKTKLDWGSSIGNDGKALVSEYVEMAECVANNNIGFDGKPLYDIDSYFDGWKRELIKERMIKRFGDKANIKNK